MKKVLATVLFVAACGGAKPPVQSPTAEMAMPVEMVKFHEVLRPLWHAEKGDKRMTDTCTAIPQLTETGTALRDSAVPAKGNADAWKTHGTSLTDKLSAMKAECDAKNMAGFETSFEGVHNEFHALMEAGGMMHSEGAEKAVETVAPSQTN